MRLLLPFVIVLFFGELSGQVPSCNAPTPYAEEAYHILKNIDKSQISTNILYEAVFPWANIDLFDGSVSTDTTNSYHFFQSYSKSDGLTCGVHIIDTYFVLSYLIRVLGF